MLPGAPSLGNLNRQTTPGISGQSEHVLEHTQKCRMQKVKRSFPQASFIDKTIFLVLLILSKLCRQDCHSNSSGSKNPDRRFLCSSLCGLRFLLWRESPPPRPRLPLTLVFRARESITTFGSSRGQGS